MVNLSTAHCSRSMPKAINNMVYNSMQPHTSAGWARMRVQERPTECVAAQQDDVAGVAPNAGHVRVLDVVDGVAGARVLSQGPAENGSGCSDSSSHRG